MSRYKQARKKELQKQARRNAAVAYSLIAMAAVLFGWMALGGGFPFGDGNDTAVHDTAATTAPHVANTAVLAMDQPAPTFTASTLNGGRASLADHAGEVVLVNFWATWCPPCKAEMPDINAYYEAHKDEGFTVLAINAREGENLVRPFIESHNLSFPILMDPDGQIVSQYQVRSFPTSIVIDRNGTVRHIQVGLITPSQLDAIITPLLQS